MYVCLFFPFGSYRIDLHSNVKCKSNVLGCIAGNISDVQTKMKKSYTMKTLQFIGFEWLTAEVSSFSLNTNNFLCVCFFFVYQKWLVIGSQCSCSRRKYPSDSMRCYVKLRLYDFSSRSGRVSMFNVRFSNYVYELITGNRLHRFNHLNCLQFRRNHFNAFTNKYSSDQIPNAQEIVQTNLKNIHE